MHLKKSWPFRLHIGTLMIGVLLISCIGLSVFIYDANIRLVEKQTAKLLNYVISRITNEVEQITESPKAVTSIISRQQSVESLGHATTFRQRMNTLPFFTEILDHTNQFLSIYAGYSNGDFFQIKKYTPEILPDKNIQSSLIGLKWIVRSIDNQDRKKHQLTTLYLDADLKILHTQKAASDYDPRKRSWFKKALQSPEIQRTDIQMFASDRQLGFIISRKTKNYSQNNNTNFYSVIGTSVYLSTLSEIIKKQQITPSSEIIIFDINGGLVAYKDINQLIVKENNQFKQGNLSSLAIKNMDDIFKQWQSGRYKNNVPFDYKLNNETWRTIIIKLKIQPGSPLFLLIAIPHNELYQQIRQIRNTALSITIVFLLIFLPVTLYLARRISTPLKRLADETDAIKSFDFSEHHLPDSNISEIDHLNTSLSDMKSTIRRFLDINMIVASEENFERLLPKLLNETLSVSKAESIALYLVNQDNQLSLAEIRTRNNNTNDLLPISETEQSTSYPNILLRAINSKKTVVAEVSSSEFREHGLNVMLQEHSSTTRNSIAIPLFNRKHELIGVMLLITANKIESSLLEFITAICSSSAITLETRSLIQAQKELFEAFVKLIAGAIDAKSPYTGGHCARVPVLTKMLAKAADEASQGYFKDFKIPDDQWEAIHIASWLHDCGKVTTPEYVVDKATKLETIYDRIHEVRMRFEVLHRDTELEFWKTLAQEPLSEKQKQDLKDRLEQQLEQLQADFAFIAQCNEGGEFMSENDIERLNKLAQITWLRYFNDRLGISEDERLRKDRQPETSLPATEHLLSDKPEHLFSRKDSHFSAPDNPWGFKMKVPQWLYNRGELYNLSVAKGTLSEEERFKINEHIVQTIIMLSELPFPRHLKSIAELAGGHHEKLDGSGYPRGLTAEQMSPVARMMAVADIFEALTAIDRPYKKGKTLSEAIKIMSFMVQERHIDGDIFKLFLTSGIYLDYARQYLKPEQIDEVDINKYI